MCQDSNDWADIEDDWDDDEDDDDDWADIGDDWEDEDAGPDSNPVEQPKKKQAMKPIPQQCQIGLIGVIFRPENEVPWTVQNNRKPLNNEFPCRTKAEVLDKIAVILDDMKRPPGKLDRGNDHVEVTVAVTLQAGLDNLDDEVNTLDLRRAASEAVGNAVHHHEGAGFDHALADRLSFGTVEVRTLNVE